MAEEKETEEIAAVEQPDPPGFLDRLLTKLSSRKLLVWGTSTYFLVSGKLTPENWLYVSLVYIGSEAAVDFIATLKKASK